MNYRTTEFDLISLGRFLSKTIDQELFLALLQFRVEPLSDGFAVDMAALVGGHTLCLEHSATTTPVSYHCHLQ